MGRFYGFGLSRSQRIAHIFEDLLRRSSVGVWDAVLDGAQDRNVGCVQAAG